MQGLRMAITDEEAFSGLITAPKISIDFSSFSNNIISLTIFIQKPEFIPDFQIIAQRIIDFITLSIDMIVIE
jgi:hypothetical protein